jgi:hypothetical protein
VKSQVGLNLCGYLWSSTKISIIETGSKKFGTPSSSEAKLFGKPIKSLLYSGFHVIHVPYKGC